MVLYDPDRKWGPQGICRLGDDKLFFADGGPPGREPGAMVQRKWDQAKEICAMCPVLKACRRDTLGEYYGVWGGLDQYERFRIRKRLSVAVRRWPEKRRLAWGEELTRLREAGLIWKDITVMTGITEGAGEYLVDYWRENQPAQGAKVVDLHLPEPEGLRKLPFPEARGRCHAWVRRHHSNIVCDAWYKGQTADGRWLYLHVAGRASSFMWASAEDVKVYEPQPVVILNYIGRPDRGAA